MKTKFKIFSIIFGVFISLIVILLILPFVINLNRFKPQIQAMVAKKVNAQLDFSSVQLTIFSGLGIQLDNVSIINTDSKFNHNKLLEVKEIKFKVDVLPLLSGKVNGNVFIDGPNIKILKDGDKNNITSLMISSPQANETVAPGIAEQKSTQVTVAPKNNVETAQTKVEPSQPKQDVAETNKEPTEDKLKNIVIESFVIQEANISYDDLAVKKPPTTIRHLNLKISNIGLDKNVNIIFSTDVNVKETDFDVHGPILLELNAKTAMANSTWQKSDFSGLLNVDKLNINFKDAFVKSSSIPFHLAFEGQAKPNDLQLENFKLTLQTLQLDGKVSLQDFKKLTSNINLHLFSNDVSSLGEILPQHKNLLSKGNFDIISTIKGALSDTNTIKTNTNLKANLFQSDFHMTADETSLQPIKVAVHMDGKQIDIGELVKPFLAPPKDNTPPLIDFKKLKLSNFMMNLNMNDKIIHVADFKMDAFDGSLISNFDANIDPNIFSYSGKINLNRIKIQELISVVNLKGHDSPIEGVADLNFGFNGSGKSREVVSKTLNAKGTYRFESGKLNTKSILGLTSEELSKFTDTLKIPGLNTGLAKLGNLDLGQNNSKGLTNSNGNFEVKNGRVLFDNNITSDQGNIKLDASVGLDETLGGSAVYTSTKILTDKLLASDKNFSLILNQNNMLVLNMTLGGTVTNPTVHIDTKNLQDNLIHNGTKLLKDKAVERIKDEIKKNPQAQQIEKKARDLLKDKGIDLNKFGF